MVVLVIDVRPPVKTDTLYAFTCELRSARGAQRGAASSVPVASTRRVLAFPDTAPRTSSGRPHLDRIRLPRPLFEKLLLRFVERQLSPPTDFGYLDHQRVVATELRAILWRHRRHPALATVRERIPSTWAGGWIDYIHDYVDPDTPAESMRLFMQHAPTVSSAGPTAVQRIRV